MKKSIIEQFGQVISPIKNEVGESEVATVIVEWVNERISVAKEILEKNDKNASRTLTQSIEPTPIVEEDGTFSIQVLANDYWDYVNSGVNGTEMQRGAPYSHKVGGVGNKGSDFKASIREWMRFRTITTTTYFDKSGAKKIKPLKTEKERDGMAFGIIKKIIKNGQKATPFMDEAFGDEALKDLEKRILKVWQ